MTYVFLSSVKMAITQANDMETEKEMVCVRCRSGIFLHGLKMGGVVPCGHFFHEDWYSLVPMQGGDGTAQTEGCFICQRGLPVGGLVVIRLPYTTLPLVRKRLG
jgi:hypothetical protein